MVIPLTHHTKQPFSGGNNTQPNWDYTDISIVLYCSRRHILFNKAALQKSRPTGKRDGFVRKAGGYRLSAFRP
jgi:hypothetical protein